MTNHIKNVIDAYRKKTEIPSRSKVVSFRVTPEEWDRLEKVFGDYTGIRDFALASTDTNFIEDEDDTDQD